MKRALLAVLATTLLPDPAFAQCVSCAALPDVLADVEAGHWRFEAGVATSYEHRGRLLLGSRELASRGYLGIGTLLVDLGVQPTANLRLQIGLPGHWKSFHENQGAAEDLAGPGDLEVVASYRLPKLSRWTAWVGGGLAFPTGPVGARPLAGLSVPTPFQLGSGTLDPLLAATIGFRATSALLFRLAWWSRLALYPNAFDFRSSSVATAEVGARYRLLGGRLEPGLDFGFSHTSTAWLDGLPLGNTGGNVLYLAARLAGSRLGALWAELRVRVPLPFLLQQASQLQFSEIVMAELRLTYAFDLPRRKPPPPPAAMDQ